MYSDIKSQTVGDDRVIVQQQDEFPLRRSDALVATLCKAEIFAVGNEPVVAVFHNDFAKPLDGAVTGPLSTKMISRGSGVSLRMLSTHSRGALQFVVCQDQNGCQIANSLLSFEPQGSRTLARGRRLQEGLLLSTSRSVTAVQLLLPFLNELCAVHRLDIVGIFGSNPTIDLQGNLLNLSKAVKYSSARFFRASRKRGARSTDV